MYRRSASLHRGSPSTVCALLGRRKATAATIREVSHFTLWSALSVHNGHVSCRAHGELLGSSILELCIEENAVVLWLDG